MGYFLCNCVLKHAAARRVLVDKIDSFNPRFILLVLLLLLNACGGTNSSRIPEEEQPVQEKLDISVDPDGNVIFENSGNPITPQELASLPQVNAGITQYADTNVMVRLQGTAIPTQDASIVTTQWVQIEGPTITLPEPTRLTSVFITPDVSEPTQLRFRLFVLDSEARGNTATVSVLVQPQATPVRVSGGTFSESSGEAAFNIFLATASSEPITARYTTQAGSATEGEDYLPAVGEILFAPGETEKSVTVVINTDVEDEGVETLFFAVTLSSETSGGSNVGVALIRDSLALENAGPLNLNVGFEGSIPLVSEVNPENLSFTSSNDAVAIVDPTGVVQAVSIGEATITVNYPQHEALTYQVIVSNAQIVFQTSGPFAIDVGTALTSPVDTNLSPAGLSYTSSNPEIASVDSESGTVQGLSPGQVTVSVVHAASEISAEYAVTVNGPQVRILEGDVIRIPFGAELILNGVATDAAGNDLPDAALSWRSNYDGGLAEGPQLSADELSLGVHDITLTAQIGDGGIEAQAQIRVLVGVENIALEASANASTTFAGYAPGNANDGSTNTATGPASSWANADNVSFPQWLTLAWESNILITNIDLYTSSGFEMQDFDIQYWDGTQWITLTTVDDNTDVYNTYGLFEISTNTIRVLARRGSSQQSTYARINELAVYSVSPLQANALIPFAATIGSELTDPELELYNLDVDLKIDSLGLNYLYSASSSGLCYPDNPDECVPDAEVQVSATSSITHRIDNANNGGFNAWLEPSGPSEIGDWTSTYIDAFNTGRNDWAPPSQTGNRLVSFKDTLWLYGVSPGVESTISEGWSSFDGLRWTPRNTRIPFFFSAIAEHNNHLYSLRNGEFYRSEDGMLWESLVPPYSENRAYEVLYSFNGFLWALSGEDADFGFRMEVWRYSPSAGWTVISDIPSFPDVIDASVAVFNDRVWLIGGFPADFDSPATTAIWSSTDGLDWQEITTANVSFEGLYGHKLIVFNDQLWSLGGSLGESGEFNQISRTADGETWTRIDNPDIFVGYYSQPTVFDNKIWVYIEADEGNPIYSYYVSENGIDWKRIHYNNFDFSDFSDFSDFQGP